ncbi:MAG: DUF6152 family protein [Bryobacteraceae bacterium]
MTFHSLFFSRSRLFAGIFVVSLPLLAHHPFSSEFDKEKPLTLKGQVQEVAWTEPHLTFTVTVPTGDLNGTWKMEGASSITLKKRGFAEAMLKNGDTVTVRGFRALNGSQSVSARSVTMADGKGYSLSDPQEDGGPVPTISGSVTETPGATFADTTGGLQRISNSEPFVILVGGFALIAAFVLRTAQW